MRRIRHCWGKLQISRFCQRYAAKGASTSCDVLW